MFSATKSSLRGIAYMQQLKKIVGMEKILLWVFFETGLLLSKLFSFDQFEPDCLFFLVAFVKERVMKQKA